MNILLVEDDKDLAEMYGLQLKHGGHRVKVAADAQAALDILDEARIQLILLDLLLPRHNGLSILYELRSYEDWRKLPVLILSNADARELGITGEMLKNLGVGEYLDKAHTKPEQLLAAVEAAMHNAKL